MTGLEKYADLYASTDILKPFGKDSRASAFLLSGEDADGLSVLARLLAARLCGIPFGRAFDDHADIMTYPKTAVELPQAVKQPQKTSKKAKKPDNARPAPLSVAEVEELVGTLYLTPFELDRRIYIIESAEGMSEICQNKLLKSLEEPPKTVCFILCASGAMLPTVESRCITIELPPFDTKIIERALEREHKGAENIELAARSSRGNLGMAERILGDPEFVSTYDTAVKIITRATGSRTFGSLAAIYEKFTREKISKTLGIMEYILGDAARYLIGMPTVFDEKDVAAASAGFTPTSAARSCEFVREAQKRAASNCMPQAIMDELLLKIMEEKALCRR